MSIQTGITALTPNVYWHLDEAAGPTAADSSGNGFNGTYGAGLNYQQAGPEAGTYAVSVPVPGTVASRVPMQQNTNAFSVMAWCALTSLNGAAAALQRNVGPNRGWDWNASGAGTFGANDRSQIVRQGVGTTNTNTPIEQDAFWHQHVLTYTPTTWTIYRDGIQIYTSNIGSFNAPNASDQQTLNAPDPGFFAHYAWWTRQLSAAEVLAAYNAHGPLTLPPWVVGMGTINPLLFTDLTTLQATADAILAAVRKSYT